MAPMAELYGLVLSGGRSRRMGRDKALLAYEGRPQLARAMQLLAPFVARRFVSVRADQRGDTQRTAFDTIADVLPDLGPIGGIHAAQNAHREAAWLILACDLPFLEPATLEHLIAHRNPARLATAYRSSHDGLPEPLCAIFEPASRPAVQAWIERGQRCPRALLASIDTELLELPDAGALENINTPQEYASALEGLSLRATTGTAGTAGSAGTRTARAPLTLHVRYFALLREQAGRGDEALETRAQTPLELYRELAHRHRLGLAPEQLRVAINEEFGDWHARLAEGDTIAFLPPVAGG
jgi:molybdopterin-guanine dinucleotide biosynthesis protein A